MIRLIVGLANPGSLYAQTRHNAGAWLIEKLIQTYDVTLQLKSALHAQCGTVAFSKSLNTQLCLPTTFMNHSGRAVYAMASYYKIVPEEILIVHDELSFPPGIARFKFKGGTGGHNGLKDILTLLKTDNFWRLRIGVGHPGDKQDVSKYVLSKPTLVEYNQIQDLIQTTLPLLKDFCMGGEEQAMQLLHT